MRRSAPFLIAFVALAAITVLLVIVLRPAPPPDADRASSASEPPSDAPAHAPADASAALADASAASIGSPAVSGSGAPAAAPEREAPPVCRKLLARNEGVLDGTSGPSQGASFSATCYPSPGGGAWGLRLDAWTHSGDWAGVDIWKGEYTVVHLDAAGQEVEAEPAWSIEDGLSYSAFDAPERFDFDGDGEPELFVRQTNKEHEGATTARAELYTFRKGKVVKYPGTPEDFEDMRDADSDGRPDLIYYPYRGLRTHPGSMFDFTNDGPALLARSLPDGTFSTKDAAAQAFARQACPAPGAGDAGAEETGVDPELCARLWGASQPKAMALLRGLCPQGLKCKGVCAEASDDCGYFKERARLLSLPPPLRISP